MWCGDAHLDSSINAHVPVVFSLGTISSSCLKNFQLLLSDRYQLCNCLLTSVLVSLANNGIGIHKSTREAHKGHTKPFKSGKQAHTIRLLA